MPPLIGRPQVFVVDPAPRIGQKPRESDRLYLQFQMMFLNQLRQEVIVGIVAVSCTDLPEQQARAIQMVSWPV
jgi:hypothetical protein